MIVLLSPFSTQFHFSIQRRNHFLNQCLNVRTRSLLTLTGRCGRTDFRRLICTETSVFSCFIPTVLILSQVDQASKLSGQLHDSVIAHTILPNRSWATELSLIHI